MAEHADKPFKAGTAAAPGNGLVIDAQALRRCAQEAEQTRQMLDELFTEEVEVELYAPDMDESEETPETLAPALRDLLAALAAKEIWSRPELAALCRQRDIMPEGALEIINDWSWAVHDAQLLLSDDAEISVDMDLLKEILDEG